MSRALLAKRAFVCLWAVLQLCHVITRYAAGKIIGGVCHGPIFLANVKAPDGSYVVSAQRNLAATGRQHKTFSHSSSRNA